MIIYFSSISIAQIPNHAPRTRTIPWRTNVAVTWNSPSWASAVSPFWPPAAIQAMERWANRGRFPWDFLKRFVKKRIEVEKLGLDVFFQHRVYEVWL